MSINRRIDSIDFLIEGRVSLSTKGEKRVGKQRDPNDDDVKHV